MTDLSEQLVDLPLSSLFDRIQRDPWRDHNPFSRDLAASQAILWANSDREAAHTELLAWLGRWQPCLFGRMAARHGAITTCLLYEEELRNWTDDQISEFIQNARSNWTKQGFHGGSSNFAILLISETLASALPDQNLFNLARRLCQLYMQRDDIEADRIYHDEIFLEANNREKTAWKWLAGVNFFGSCADGRWWLDHRIPGGIGLSINSVGHLVKSRILANAEQAYNRAIETATEEDDLAVIDSLETATVWAMRTINNASDTQCGKATYLVPVSEESGNPPCKLPPGIANFDHRYYEGYYHTDFTLPSLYFVPDVTRPPIAPSRLDLTYLTVKGVGNPDHTLMGTGRRIREDQRGDNDDRTRVATPEVISIADYPRLVGTMME